MHFEALESWIEQNSQRLKKRFHETKAPLKVWSAACSRGQEVYSLAMFLEFVLFKKHAVPFQILGTDIDEESLKYAHNGVYPIKEVNTIPQQYLNGYWKKGTGQVKDFAAVSLQLKEKTKFVAMNLLDLRALSSVEKFDVIFARNVFIYFSENNVQKIALALKNHLEEEGLFASGLSEPMRFPGWDLETIASSCYIKREKNLPMMVATNQASFSSVKAEPCPQKKYRVLCVDDSGTIQTLMKRIFSQDSSCLNVTAAMNGIEAREKLDAEKFDLITLDIHMPIMGGIEFLERAYNKIQDPPVIMVSSVNRTDIDLATKSMALGAFDYVEKPAMNKLQKSIDEILTKAKMALRSKEVKNDEITSQEFNQSIGQKIAVPDASQCFRWICTSSGDISLLEPIIKMQQSEYRSPPLLISASRDQLALLEANVLIWT